MRFAWQRKNSANYVSVKQSFTSRLTYIAYNAIWWIPMLLPFTNIIDHRTGFIAFTVILFVRLVANLYRNNVLNLEQAESFPFRAP